MASRVEGLARLKARFASIPKRMKASVKAAIDLSADELVAFQKRLAPKDEGELEASIHTEPGRHELSVAVVASVPKGIFDVARLQEFGTVDMPAQPFFFPPFRANRKRMRSRIGRAVGKAVRGNV